MKKSTAQAMGVIALIFGGCAAPGGHGGDPVDLDLIRAADWAYANAWLSNEPERVMATLTEDAVLAPSNLGVIEGVDAIREFWWPADAAPTTVTDFTLSQVEAGGSGNMGFVRGSFSLDFAYDGTAYSNQGEYLSLFRKGPDGSWRISHRMWNDHP